MVHFYQEGEEGLHSQVCVSLVVHTFFFICMPTGFVCACVCTHCTHARVHAEAQGWQESSLTTLHLVFEMNPEISHTATLDSPSAPGILCFYLLSLGHYVLLAFTWVLDIHV